MAFWDERAGAADNLRLYAPGEGWKAYADQQDADGKTRAVGSRRHVESALLNALNANNLVVLTGTGSSFAAKNPAAEPDEDLEMLGIDPPLPLTPAGMWDVWVAVREKVGPAVFGAVCASFPQAPINDNIERLLTLCKLHLELHETATDEATERIRRFVGDAEQAILARVDFVSRSTLLEAHTSFIQKIGRRGVRKPRTKLFTTNYDLCFEEAARRLKFTIVDGFSHALDQVYDRSFFDFDIVRREAGNDTPDYIENVFQLYKLHGSIDWRRVDGEIRRSRGDEGAPVLIYPRSSKYQEAFEAPYLDMIGAMQTALREPDTAVIISGFGFNDDHLSRPILSAIESNLSIRLVVCDPAFIPGASLDGAEHTVEGVPPPTNKFLNAFYQLVDRGDPRVHLINGRFEDLAFALPDLVGETDRERHMNRVRALRDGAGEAP
ncbi:MAG: SIR2 family protein [Brevundimonas sp.]|nr:SIR2 family protein [Brevundimonas sp.]